MNKTDPFKTWLSEYNKKYSRMSIPEKIAHLEKIKNGYSNEDQIKKIEIQIEQLKNRKD